jgi:hypothetical protein
MLKEAVVAEFEVLFRHVCMLGCGLEIQKYLSGNPVSEPTSEFGSFQIRYRNDDSPTKTVCRRRRRRRCVVIVKGPGYFYQFTGHELNYWSFILDRAVMLLFATAPKPTPSPVQRALAFYLG